MIGEDLGSLSALGKLPAVLDQQAVVSDIPDQKPASCNLAFHQSVSVQVQAGRELEGWETGSLENGTKSSPLRQAAP